MSDLLPWLLPVHVEARPDCRAERRDAAAVKVAKAVCDLVGVSVGVTAVDPDTLARSMGKLQRALDSARSGEGSGRRTHVGHDPLAVGLDVLSHGPLGAVRVALQDRREDGAMLVRGGVNGDERL